MKLPALDRELAKQVIVKFIRNEVEKSPYDKCIMGLSGGIDSAVVAYLACEAVGNKNLIGLLLPYKTSTPDILEDAKLVAKNLGIRTIELDITPMIDSFIKNHPHKDPRRLGSKMVRERTALLYYYADIYQSVVLGTCNKSETLLGYFTKFGDPASDILPLKNLYKTHVIELAKAIGIPKSIIDKPPGGGMWPGQKDEDEFGFSYEDADPLLYYMVDIGYAADELEEMGFDPYLIIKIAERVAKSEFKRRPPLVPILPKGAIKQHGKKNYLGRMAIVYDRAHRKNTEKKIYKERPWMKGKSLRVIKETIKKRGFEVVTIASSKKLIDNLISKKVDIVFNLLVGGRGVCSQTFLPATLDFLGIPLTGSGVYGHALALDKSITKQILRSNGIPTPPSQVFHKPTEKLSSALKFPLIVKPVAEGSSRGIEKECVVVSKRELQVMVKQTIDKFNQPAIVERFIGGREFTVGIVGNLNPECFAILEINGVPSRMKDEKIFTGELKVREGYITARTHIAKLSKEEAIKHRDLALKTYRALRCRDYARVDIIVDNTGAPWVIEINSMPGLFMDYSGYVASASKAGLSYPQLINKILDSAIERYPLL